MKQLAAFLLLLFTLPCFATIEIRGGTNFGTVIPNGDTTPRDLDGTDFGDVTVPGSKTVSFQAKAIGSQETISAIVEDGNAWSISSGGGFGAIGAGSARTFSVTLEPTSAGYKSATVTIVTVSSGNYSFKVEGNALGEPEIVVRGQVIPNQPWVNITDGDSTPTPTDGTNFGIQGVSDGAVTHTFQIENTGTGQLVIDSITDNSSEFSISGAPATVGVGNTQTFSVKFNPTSYGLKTATITIQNNDANEDPFTFTVNGTGEAPEIQILGGDSQTINIANGDTTPRTLDNTDFGTYVAGSGAVTKVFKIKNNGNDTLSVTGVFEDANAFSITGAPTISTPIAPGGSDNFNIILNADVAGTKYGTVVIQTNDPDNGVFTFDITAEATGDPEIVVRGRLNSATSWINIPNNDTTPTPTDGTDFGSKGVNDGFVEHLFQIENTGNAKLNIASITDDSSAFSVVDVPSSVTVGNTQTFGVRFDPGSSGEKTATVTIDNDDPDGGEDPYVFQVTGTGLFGKAQIYGGTNFGEFISNNDDTPTTTDGTDFGSVSATGGSKTNTFRIKNEGNETLTIFGISEDGSAFSVASHPAYPAAIAAGGSRDFSIEMAPTSAGAKAATVTVLTSDTVNGRDTYSFDLIGEATGTADLVVKGRQLPNLAYQAISNGSTATTPVNGTHFGTVAVGSDLTRTFQITNTGSAQLTINSITETSSQFSISGAPSVVGVNQDKTFNVTFDPTSFGDKSTYVTIETNVETFTFKIAGTGEAGKLAVYGGTMAQSGLIPNGSRAPGDSWGQDFTGFAEVGERVSRGFALINEGNATLTITAATEDGVAWELDRLGGFRVLAPGELYDFGIAIEPVSAGYKNAIVSIASSDPDVPIYTFEVFANIDGESEPLVLGQVNAASPFVPIPDGATATTTGNGTSFGDQGVDDGGLSHTFQIKNEGTAQLQISSISETSPHFSISGAPTVVGVNQTQDFTVTFNPTSLGQKTATITVASDAPGSLASYTFVVSGTGEASEIAVKGGTNFVENISNNDITPREADGTDFGNVNVNSTIVTRTFQIKNEGNETLTLVGSASNNSDFTLSGVPGPTTPIAPGSTNDFTITFDPSATGFSTATIILQSNDPDENPFSFVVEGFGTDDNPEIKVTGKNNENIPDGSTTVALRNGTAFGQVDVNGATKRQSFTVENLGTGTLSVSSVTENGAAFSLAGTTSGSVLPGESISFDVVFDPPSAAIHQATVTILSDDANEGTFTFAVQGQGTTTPPPAEPDIVVKGGETLDAIITNGDTNPRFFDGTDVGNIIVGESETRTFRISNNGTATLNVSSVTLGSNASAIGSFPNKIEPGASGDFTVTFSPASPGVRTGTIRILSDDPDDSPYDFTVTTTGVEPSNMLAITDIAVEGENLRVTFVSNPTKTYRIAFTENLSTPTASWTRPPGLAGLTGDINEQSYLITDVVKPDRPKAFLRIEEE